MMRSAPSASTTMCRPARASFSLITCAFSSSDCSGKSSFILDPSMKWMVISRLAVIVVLRRDGCEESIIRSPHHEKDRHLLRVRRGRARRARGARRGDPPGISGHAGGGKGAAGEAIAGRARGGRLGETLDPTAALAP